MGRTSHDHEPTDGFMDQQFARFREERLKSRKSAPEALATPATPPPTLTPPVAASTPDPTEAPPAEHLDGADDDFARFRAARIRDRGPSSGRMRLPTPAPTNGGHVPLEPVRSTRTRAALEAGIEVESAPGGAILEPHAKAAIAPVERAEAAAPAIPTPAAQELTAEADFDHFRAQRATNRQVQVTEPTTAVAPDDGLFFGTSSQERRSVGARVKESRSDLSTDAVAAMLVERTPPQGQDASESTPPGGRRRAPPPALPVRENPAA